MPSILRWPTPERKIPRMWLPCWICPKLALMAKTLSALLTSWRHLKLPTHIFFDTVPNLSGYVSKSGSNGYDPGGEPKDNPFKKETWNLTKQGQLLRDNPELYKKLAAAAGAKV